MAKRLLNVAHVETSKFKTIGKKASEEKGTTFYDINGKVVSNELEAVAKESGKVLCLRQSLATKDPLNPFSDDLSSEFGKSPEWTIVERNAFDLYLKFLKTRNQEDFTTLLDILMGA